MHVYDITSWEFFILSPSAFPLQNLFCKLRLHPVCFTHTSRMTQYRSLVFPLVVGLVLRWQHSHFVFQVLNNSVFMNLVLQFLFEIKKKIIIYCKLEFFPIHFLNVTLFCKCYVCFFVFVFLVDVFRRRLACLQLQEIPLLKFGKTGYINLGEAISVRPSVHVVHYQTSLQFFQFSPCVHVQFCVENYCAYENKSKHMYKYYFCIFIYA